MAENNGVPKVLPITEEKFRARFLQSLNRLIGDHGEAKVALWLGVSTRHLGGNVLRGSAIPTADKIWNLLAHDESAHDEIDREYGAKKVPLASHCTTDPIAAKMAALLTRAIEAESPQSPGGTVVTYHEIAGMDEPTLRAVHRRLGAWIDQLEAPRAPSSLRVA